MRNIIIFTCIFGDIKDRLRPLENVPSCVRLVAYIEGVHKERQDDNGWTMMPAVWEHRTNPRLRARRHKLSPHQLFPGATHSLWLDGCLTLTCDPNELIDEYLSNDIDICVFKHRQRQCIYDEARACKKLRKDDPVIIDRLMARYQKEGYPELNGLAETTAVLRAHNGRTVLFNNTWWTELRANSVRDQLSFDYLIWKMNYKYATFRGDRCTGPHFKWRAHR